MTNHSQQAVVTGATGFLGRTVVRLLLERGISITIITRNRERAAALFAENQAIHIIEADLTDQQALRNIPQEAAIFHCAAITGSSHTSKKEYDKINVDGTLSLLNASVKRNATRFAFVSSASAVGAVGSIANPITEQTLPNPKTFYGISKLNAETMILKTAPDDLPITIIRPPLIYGQEQNAFSGAGLLFNLCRKKMIPILGSPNAQLSLIYVDNAANGLIDLTYRNQKKEIFNLSDADPLSVKQLAILIQGNKDIPRFIRIPYSMLFPFALVGDGFSSLIKKDIRFCSEHINILARSGFVMNIEKALQSGYSPISSVQGIQATIANKK